MTEHEPGSDQRRKHKVYVDLGSDEWVRMLCRTNAHGDSVRSCRCAAIREAFEAGGLAFESIAMDTATTTARKVIRRAEQAEAALARLRRVEQAARAYLAEGVLEGGVLLYGQRLDDLRAALDGKEDQ